MTLHHVALSEPLPQDDEVESSTAAAKFELPIPKCAHR